MYSLFYLSLRLQSGIYWQLLANEYKIKVKCILVRWECVSFTYIPDSYLRTCMPVYIHPDRQNIRSGIDHSLTYVFIRKCAIAQILSVLVLHKSQTPIYERVVSTSFIQLDNIYVVL